MKAPATPEITLRSVEQLIPYARNARTHSDEQIAQIAASIREFGWTNPVLLDGNDGIIAGHARLQAARKLGLKQVPCLELAHLTEAQKRAYILADNRLALNAGWDLALLAGEIQDLKGEDFDLNLLGFDQKELGELLAYTPEGGTEGLTDPDEAPEAPSEPVTQAGDLWVLGKHRLLCGDATKREDVERLMAGITADLVLTDPPYGVSYSDKNRFLNAISRGNCIQKPISADHQEPKEMQTFWENAFTAARPALKPGGAYYVTGPQGGDLLLLLQSLSHSGFPLRHMLIWAKNNHVLGRCDYHYKHEPIIYGWADGAGHSFYGSHGETSLWEIPKPQKSDLHPTMKPVALYERCVCNSSKSGDVVFDFFSGSGSSMIACERTGRTSCSLEIDLAYCDVIVTRWQNFTGKQAGLAEDGRTFEQVKEDRMAVSA